MIVTSSARLDTILSQYVALNLSLHSNLVLLNDNVARVIISKDRFHCHFQVRNNRIIDGIEPESLIPITGIPTRLIKDH